MKPILTTLSILVLTTFLACNSNTKNSYAIHDFSKSLQPYLVHIASKGIVTFDTAASYIEQHATDKELKQLSQCENPVIRAIAFREMLERPTFDHFNLIMNNLDDTALVFVDEGEFGLLLRRVSDHIIENGKWKDTVAKNKTIDEIILKHNFLKSAYDVVDIIKPKAVYYSSIKDMALRNKYAESTGVYIDERDFKEVENALYALAAFKKSEDIPLIKQILLDHSPQMTSISFTLMRAFPNEAYLEVFEKYYQYHFYRQIREKIYGDIDDAESFINSIATYKNERSAAILDKILNRKPLIPCTCVDTGLFKNTLVYAIWNNKCDAYTKLENQISPSIKKYEAEKAEDERRSKDIPPLEVDTTWYQEDTSKPKEPISWWR